MKMGGMCLNWKIVAGLGVVGLGVWVVAPSLIWAVLPLLILAACPLSMLLMMRGMQGGQCASRPAPVSQPTRIGLTREQQLAELQVELAELQLQQATIAREIARLEAVERAREREAESAPAVREAEAVAGAADERARDRS
jgi:hypothetical protein